MLPITRRSLLQTSAAWACAHLVAGDETKGPAHPPSSYFDGDVRAVNLAGAEFGTDSDRFSNRRPGVHGVDYLYPSAPTIEYFAAHGFRLFRLPVCWERLQPELGGPLDQAELAHVRRVINTADGCDGKILIDLHNYARYRTVIDGRPQTCVIDQRRGEAMPIPRRAFADFWCAFAEAVGSMSGIGGYGLMNEPHDLGDSDWKQISQAATDAIRAVDQSTSIVVAGNGWSSAERFEVINGNEPWIRDPVGRTVYEAHCYFDSDGSGKYARTFEQESSVDARLLDRGIHRISPFVTWCRRNGVTGFLGEFGIPGKQSGWTEIMKRTLRFAAESGLHTCYWAAGDWWGDYPLSIQPRDGFTVAAPQLTTLLTYN